MQEYQEVKSNNVILRMKFSQPSPPNYLKGKERLAYMEERAWVSNDFIDYAARDGKYAGKSESHVEKLVAPDKGTYLEYVSRQGVFADKGEKGESRADGTGVWGKNGVLEGDELEKVKEIFKSTKGNIWHGLISPTKEMGDKFLGDKESAMEFTKACFTRFLSSTHLNYDNVEWYCGWHDDSASGIKHIQFAFCEKEPHLNSRGQKSYTQKGTIRKSVLADALVNFEEYFSGHRNDVHVARDDLSQRFKKLGLHDIKADIALKVLALAQELPKVSGHAGYRHEAYAPYRGKIDKLANELIRDVPELNKSYINLMSKVAERETRFKKTAEGFEKMTPTDKIAELRQDIQQRLGNSIISLSKRFNFTAKTEDFEILRQKKLSLMVATTEESKLRRQQQTERRQEQKRFKRLFGEWWKETTSPNYLEQFYKELARIRAEKAQEIIQDEEKEE